MEAKTTRKFRMVWWPSPQDYNESMQTPEGNLIDAELAAGAVFCDERGIPRPVSGNFATVYRVFHADREWAVRCFLHEVPDLQQRYELIEQALQKLELPCFVSCAYQANGILVDGTAYPLLKMKWCQGKPLDRYIDDLITSEIHGLSGGQSVSRKLNALADHWLVLLKALQAAGIAHGDLQHGNILVENEQIVLVDYDGMFVPGMNKTGYGLAGTELGHANYQHPGRDTWHFDETIDNFSGWLIYIALRCLAIDPELWLGSPGKECLLFTRHDLKAPKSSLMFRRLCSHANADVQHYGRCLKYFLAVDVNDVPPVCAEFAVPEQSSGDHQEQTYDTIADDHQEPPHGTVDPKEGSNKDRQKSDVQGLLFFSLPLLFLLALLILIPLIDKADFPHSSAMPNDASPRIGFASSPSAATAIRFDSQLYNSYQQGSYFYHNKQYEQAKDYLEKVSNASPLVAEDHELLNVRERLAIIYARNGEHDKAMNQFALAHRICNMLGNEDPSKIEKGSFAEHVQEHREWIFAAMAACAAEAGRNEQYNNYVRSAASVRQSATNEIKRQVEDVRNKLREYNGRLPVRRLPARDQ